MHPRGEPGQLSLCPHSSVLPGRETDIGERANSEKVMAHLPKTYSDFYLYFNLLELLIYVCEVL